jgi:hypothetical protein
LPPDPTIGVGGKHGLVPLVFGPVDVALVMIPDQDLPAFGRLAMTVGFARLPIDHSDALFAFAVDVSAGIEGILE